MGLQHTAMISGAASGIGLALSQVLSERGYRLALFDVDAAALEGVASDLQAEIAVVGDVADPASFDHFASTVGAVDLLCLNAGVTSTWEGPPWEAPPQEWDRVLGVNLLGVVNGLRSFLPLMLESDSPSHILITASLAGAATWPGGGPYAASKHAVLAVAEQTALELADTMIGVTVLCPALVRTGMSEHGEEARVVAEQALANAAHGRFGMVPPEWASAVNQRAQDLVSGELPTLPQPST